MCEHEFESLRTADGSFCMTACRKCMKSTGEIEAFCKAENRIAAAEARMKRMEDALLEIKNGTQEAFAYDKAKAALEGKP